MAMDKSHVLQQLMHRGDSGRVSMVPVQQELEVVRIRGGG